MSTNITAPADYRAWLGDLKARFRQVQLKAVVAVNTELLQFYWGLGADIVAKQATQAWGSGFLEKLSQDLMQEFPEMKGFSKRNLEQIRRWYGFWSTPPAIAKQAASQLLTIPWWHNVVIMGLATYTLSHTLPEALRDKLPSIEVLGADLGYSFPTRESEHG
jgi:hypothetical protein